MMASMKSSFTVRAPAKVNLHLGVGAAREDGFHPLDTVYQAIGIYDDVTAEMAADWSVDVAAADYIDQRAVPVDGTNIVSRAAAMLSGDVGGAPARLPGARIHIRKDIPVAAGLAGGSADGAAALIALDRLWGCGTSDEELLSRAAALGSDVPFALIGGTAHGTGRGELVEPITDPGTWWWVVALSQRGLSTPEVYAHWDRLFPEAEGQPASGLPVLTAIASGSAQALAAAMYNDLEVAAYDLRPDLEALVAHGTAAGALRGMVTGSGPTVVFLCSSADHAREVGASISATDRVVLVANGAVAGAHLVTYS
jgi:4-diphosphocytidyl-2-C-methyl-D-erythritol kinase